MMSTLRIQNYNIIGQGVPEISVRTDKQTHRFAELLYRHLRPPTAAYARPPADGSIRSPTPPRRSLPPPLFRVIDNPTECTLRIIANFIKIGQGLRGFRSYNDRNNEFEKKSYRIPRNQIFSAFLTSPVSFHCA